MSSREHQVPDPDAVSTASMEGLVQRLGRKALFEVAADSLRGALPFDQLGLARLRRRDRAWELRAFVDRDAPGAQFPEERFAFTGTAGAWVLSSGTPFVGPSLRQVKRFPHTHTSLVRTGMRSNAVVPVRVHGPEPLVLYALSSREDAFAEDRRDAYHRAVAHLAPMLASCVARPTPVPIREPEDETLDGMQARHIRATLDRCGGVIEGEHGAAHVLGVKPSTLRHRMNRFGIERPARSMRVLRG